MSKSLDSTLPGAIPFRSITASLSWLGGVGILLLMVPTVLDVTYRYVAGGSLLGMVEYSEIAIPIVVYLGVAHALREGAHISTPIATSRLRPPLSDWARLFGRVIVLLIVAFAAWRTFVAAEDAVLIREFRMGSVSVPTWPARIVVALGFALLTIEVAIDVAERFRRLLVGEQAPIATDPVSSELPEI
ncbi:MAG TPA: TRAP transporter small permease [Rhizobiaceae bacterium]|nr:TRAP transporter small permease [Rhizobiaceae bacterium]